LCLCLLIATSVMAQEGIILSLQTPETTLQTGQEYTVEIHIDGAADVWALSVEISYDPALIYVFGTRAGRPIQAGTFFEPAQSSPLRNMVQTDTILYDVSLLRPATPANGSGIVGTFRIYPLAPGATSLLFRAAKIIKLDFVQTDEGLVGQNPQELPFTPALINLTITGDPVQPPSEATATPLPTETPEPTQATIGEVVTEEATLVNITLAPRTPTPLPLPDAPDSGQSSLLPLAIGIMVLSGLGLLVLWVYWSRSRRK
jgi:hypothetical protein